MDAQTLADELNKDPFIPLRLHLFDGRAIDIRNSSVCFIARLALYLFATQPGQSLAQDVQVISLRHIVSIEKLSPQQAA